MLSIDDILNAKDHEVKEIPCPEWGGSVYVKTLTADQRDALEDTIGKDPGNRRAIIAATAMCDENGNSLSITKAQIKALGRKATGPIERIVDTVAAMNGMTAQATDDAKKNSETTPDDD